MTPLEQINQLLPSLDTAALQEVRARCVILAQGAGSRAQTAALGGKLGPSDADVDLVLEEIAGYLRAEGVEYASPDILRRVGGYGKFAEKVPPVMKALRKATTNKVKLRALIRISIDFLYKDLARMQVSASTRTMMAHWHRVPSVINRNFPGYMRGGFLGLLLSTPLPEASMKYVEDRRQQRRAAK